MADDLTTKGTKNEVEGVAKQAEGRIRNAAGGLVGDVEASRVVERDATREVQLGAGGGTAVA